jgi:Transposase, Mutator family
MSVSRVIEKVMHGWMGRGWKRMPISTPRQPFTLQTANVLNYLPKSVQTKAKTDLHAIYEAASRADAEAAFDRFLAKYQAKYDKAATCLAKDREALLAFYDFPAEHWKYVRSTNPVESTSRPCAFGPTRPRAACRVRPRSPWSSSSPGRPSGTGAG